MSQRGTVPQQNLGAVGAHVVFINIPLLCTCAYGLSSSISAGDSRYAKSKHKGEERATAAKRTWGWNAWNPAGRRNSADV